MSHQVVASDGKKTLVVSTVAPSRNGVRLTDVDTIGKGDSVSFRVSVRYTNYAKATKSYKINKKDSVYINMSVLGKNGTYYDEQIKSVPVKKQKGTDVVGHVSFVYPLKSPYFFLADGLKIEVVVNEEALSTKIYSYVFHKRDTAPPPVVIVADLPTRPATTGKAKTSTTASADTKTAKPNTEKAEPKPVKEAVKEKETAKIGETPKHAVETTVKETPKPQPTKEPAPKATEKATTAIETPKATEKTTATIETAKAPEKTVTNEAPKATDKPAAVTDNNTNSSKPAEKKNFYFAVQLTAGKLKQAKLDEVTGLFGQIEQQEVKPGVIRYMFGQYTSYGEANKGLAKAKQNGYADAFITCYEGGLRMPPARVQELAAKNP
jgi:hypothetical protein